MTNRDQFSKYMATLGEIHDKTITTLLLDLYWGILEAFPDEKCKAAFEKVIIRGAEDTSSCFFHL